MKNRIRDQFFQEYDATPIIGDIDFAVTLRQDEELSEPFDREYFLWAEAKAGTKEDILASFVQLIITIGKARTHEKLLPPRFLGAFDEEKIAFIEFHNVMEVFYQNDFNWNVTPSNHETREFLNMVFSKGETFSSVKHQERRTACWYSRPRGGRGTGTLVHKVSVRSPFVLRSFSVRSSFVLRSSFVRPSFQHRSDNESVANK